MSEHIKNFIDKIQNGETAEAGDAFKDALRDKVASALDNTRKDLAGQLFQATPFSVPKPEIQEPSAETVPPEMKVPETPEVSGSEDTGSGEQN